MVVCQIAQRWFFFFAQEENLTGTKTVLKGKKTSLRNVYYVDSQHLISHCILIKIDWFSHWVGRFVFSVYN